MAVSTHLTALRDEKRNLAATHPGPAATSTRAQSHAPTAAADSFPLPAGFKLSVAMPVYNECRTLRAVMQRVLAIPLPLEIVVVDDCSTDGTYDVLLDLQRTHGIRVFRHERNRGKGASLRTAFGQVTGDVVVVQDADLEYNPADIPRLVRPIVENRADVVYGSRFLANPRQDPSFMHRLGNRMLTWASNLFTRLKLTDMETCYKVFRRDVLTGLTLRQERFGIEPEFTAKIARRRYRVCELPVSYAGRSYAEGKKIGFKDAVNTLYCIVRYALAD